MICCAGQGRLANFSRGKHLWSLRTTAGARSVGWKRLSHPTTPGLVKTISANVAIRCHDTEHSWRFLTRSRRRGKRWRSTKVPRLTPSSPDYVRVTVIPFILKIYLSEQVRDRYAARIWSG